MENQDSSSWAEELINADPHWDEDDNMVFVIPYLEEAFEDWLVAERKISRKSAKDYIRAYESVYESLYDLVGIDLYEKLRAFIAVIPRKTGSDFTRENAFELVDIYVETMQEELNENPLAYSNAEQRAILAYHDFILDFGGNHSNPKLLKDKAESLPDEEEFLEWLERTYGYDYERARKIASSVKCVDLELRPLIDDQLSFLEKIRVIHSKEDRKRYVAMVEDDLNSKTNDITASTLKTIKNGLANIKIYITFLNEKL